MTSPATAETKAEAVAFYAVTRSSALTAEAYSVTTTTIHNWARAAGLVLPHGRTPQERCRRGHLMAETRHVSASGVTTCGECRREWRKARREAQ